MGVSDAPLIFVYGSLRRGEPPNDDVRRFHQDATFVSAAEIPGALYRIDWYPGLVDATDGLVQGEVWALSGPGMLDFLDRYERVETGQYIRERRSVATPEGAMEVWVYIYAHPVNPANRLASGDWSDALNSP